MPTETTPAAAPAIQPMPVEHAGQLVHEQIYVPTFFQKMAEHGVQPRTAAEAGQLLRIGHQLLVKHSQEQHKQAAATGSFLDQLEQELAGETGQGSTGYQPAAATHPLIKQSADQLAGHPQLAHAVLSLMAQAQA